jgi:hypothetical protein
MAFMSFTFGLRVLGQTVVLGSDNGNGNPLRNCLVRPLSRSRLAPIRLASQLSWLAHDGPRSRQHAEHQRHDLAAVKLDASHQLFVRQRACGVARPSAFTVAAIFRATVFGDPT